MSKLTQGLGEKFLTMNIYMKRYPCHGNCQAPLQALQQLQAAHRIAAADVETIAIGGTREMVERNGMLEPRDPLVAQNSVPFSVAVAFFRDPRDPRSFDQAATADRDILALCKRVTLHHDGNAAASVTVTLKDGRVLKEQIEQVKGTPALPPSRGDVYEKFSLLTRHCPKPKMDEIFDRLQNIEGEKNFDWLQVPADAQVKADANGL